MSCAQKFLHRVNRTTIRAKFQTEPPGGQDLVRKTEAELAARFPAAMARVAAAGPRRLETFADAEAYAAQVVAMVRLARPLSAK